MKKNHFFEKKKPHFQTVFHFFQKTLQNKRKKKKKLKKSKISNKNQSYNYHTLVLIIKYSVLDLVEVLLV